MTQSHPTPSSVDPQTTLGAIERRVSVIAAVVGGIGLLLAFGIGLTRGNHLRYVLHAYLTNYCYFLSLTLGAFFFVALQHATRAGWSVTVRRVSEILAANISILIILFVPILVSVLLGSASLYEWADPKAAAHDSLLAHKAAYLNPTSFAVRCIAYFAVWSFLSRYFLTKSVEQDESAAPDLTRQMERLSPLALVLFSVTITFAAFDWLMSLEPHWFSTIFGVYYFSGAVVGFLAVVILFLIGLQATGRLTESVTIEHYHDLGKLLFAFTVFWGYIAFSQYLLIWYANIPEETVWYLVRQSGPWAWVSLVLLFSHLLIPFFGLLSRHAKRRKAVLGFWAAWLLVAHWIDMYWLVMPNSDPAHLPLGLIDIGCFIGIGGLYLAGLLRVAGNRSLVPLADPRLGEALAFENL